MGEQLCWILELEALFAILDLRLPWKLSCCCTPCVVSLPLLRRDMCTLLRNTANSHRRYRNILRNTVCHFRLRYVLRSNQLYTREFKHDRQVTVQESRETWSKAQRRSKRNERIMVKNM